MAYVSRISSQTVLETTNAELNVLGEDRLIALSATNKHTSNAIIISVYAIPSDNLKSGTDTDHLIWHTSLTASSTSSFELHRSSINLSHFRLVASASAGSDVTLTVFGI